MFAAMIRHGCAASVALIALAAAASAIDVAAQPTQPIYLQYDGFVRNSDGTLTVSFGYFNMNNVDVEVPPGPANTFMPGPADRNQPIVFLKGRHRFACSMVVDRTFNGLLQWSVTFAGKTIMTTAKALDPLYELELGSQKHATEGLDIASAPKNVCVNRPPTVALASSPFEAPATGTVALAARVGQDLALPGRVEDDGLPRGSKVTPSWKQTGGPAGVTFADTAAASTHATFGAAGSYELQLSASDGEKTGTLKVTVTVAEK
jgi:hypothetical protein